MPEYKKAALSLHELNRHDREWLLKRLPGPHRRELKKMLSELDALGIPHEQGWMSELESDEARAPDLVSAPAESAGDSVTDALIGAEPERIRMILEDESDAVVTTVLAAGEWPWSSGFLSSCKSARRARLQGLFEDRQRQVPEKVTRSLLRALARRLDLEPLAPRSSLNGHQHRSLMRFARRVLWQR